MSESPASIEFSGLVAELRALALEAGQRMQSAVEQGHHREVSNKGRVDLVTRVDHDVQAFLLEAIARRFPGEAVVAEEGDAGSGTLDPDTATWFVDPVDGTTNFVYGHPFYCVSIARIEPHGDATAAVFAPALDELFLAEAGRGAALELPLRRQGPRRLHATHCDSLDRALLATGFPYHRGATARLNLHLVGHALTRCRGIRRGGSAALDLCYVGAGRLDGYWEMALQPWDVAAGVLVAREAGARVTDFLGRDEVLFGRRVCAAAPTLHDELLAMIARGHATPDGAPFGPAPAQPYDLEGPLPTETIPKVLAMETVEILVVLSTCADEEGAARIGRQLVEEQLVACAQIETAGLRSIYGWQGTVHDEREFLLRLKSAPERRVALMERLAELHPYEVPQIVVGTARASAAYGEWVRVRCDLEGSTQG